ncbi:MAG: ABC transporter ATP-binding protein [Coriobacteriales bacterium]|jgi:ABC-2 type transport system ATP-binding protein|nr:ABC transporter ATP-binding protein [Coriobacteriales bacterium]
MSVLETVGLTKRFGKAQALAGVDLSMETGEIYGFIGPNGAGKSTTIRVLLGIIRASRGVARIFGKDAWSDAVQIHERIAYVPGDVNLWNNLSGGEVIDLFLRLRKGHDRHYRNELIERFDLDPTKKCGTYSKGNRQKVALVAAFSADADLYILDEPTSGLDPLMELIFRQCVAEAKAAGASVFLSSHILSEVEHLCDRISIIRQGRIIDSGSLAEMRHLTRNKVTLEAAAPLDGLALLPGVHDLVMTNEAAANTAGRGATTGNTVSFSLDNTQTSALLAFLADRDVRHFVSTPPTLEELFMSHYEGR